jgi:8-oxo-dGTP pyrophosphatase MutT (NUDIX family)
MATNNINPWKKLNTKLVYKNPWVSLVEDEVINPDGSEGVYAVLNIRYAIGVIALDRDGYIHLVGQYRYAVGEFAWEVVEGGVEEGEDALVTAKRELKEELGFVSNNWEQLGSEIHISNCHTSERAKVFLAKDIEFVGASPEGSEILQTKKIHKSEFLMMGIKT